MQSTVPKQLQIRKPHGTLLVDCGIGYWYARDNQLIKRKIVPAQWGFSAKWVRRYYKRLIFGQRFQKIVLTYSKKEGSFI